MVQEDYIKKILNSLHLVFAKILKMKVEGNHTEAEVVIKEAVKNITGLNLIVISSFGLSDILRMMSGYDENIATNKEKLISVSRLLYEYGEIQNIQGKEKAGIEFYLKSLLLHLHAMKVDEKNLIQEDFSQLDKLINTIGKNNISDPLRTDINKLSAMKL